jgi:hypothetical protein
MIDYRVCARDDRWSVDDRARGLNNLKLSSLHLTFTQNMLQ